MMPVLNLGWGPGMWTMAWQQINYFAIADVKIWGVKKISLPRLFWEKYQSNLVFLHYVHILAHEYGGDPPHQIVTKSKTVLNSKMASLTCPG